MEKCFNHPDRDAFSFCHNCGKHFCKECLIEGNEYYYCKDPHCSDNSDKINLSQKVTCPKCNSFFSLNKNEIKVKKAHCPQCEAFIDFNTNPPAFEEMQNFVEIIWSMNQGDIAVIKSVLDDANINYYVLGDNFLRIDPLIQPARIFVPESEADEVKELLKDMEVHIVGVSLRNDLTD